MGLWDDRAGDHASGAAFDISPTARTTYVPNERAQCRHVSADATPTRKVAFFRGHTADPSLRPFIPPSLSPPPKWDGFGALSPGREMIGSLAQIESITLTVRNYKTWLMCAPQKGVIWLCVCMMVGAPNVGGRRV